MTAHVIRGRAVDWKGRPGVQAACSCPWRGPERYGPMQTRLANEDADAHREDVRRRGGVAP